MPLLHETSDQVSCELLPLACEGFHSQVQHQWIPNAPLQQHLVFRIDNIQGDFFNWPNMHTWERQISSRGVSMKRSCKMQFRHAGLRSIGLPVRSYDLISFLAWWPQHNYNVKLQSGGLSFLSTQFGEDQYREIFRKAHLKIHPVSWNRRLLC